ncbi:uncharacterized protein LOC117282348 [Cryptotermes secundus]|uniref:uncharacterized protein LOC117282348 n=1 Tax=Cryptotermes secundus TaxID=105785 RepID=UPI001454C31F|nr:uncharacterized protein LOC117282348 [Cryptotermes secundus]
MAAVMFLAVQTASGIMCFQCNSARDPGCEDISGNNTSSSYYKPCVQTIGQTKPFFCRTIKQTIKVGGNLVRVVRSCGWEKHSRRQCYDYEDENHREWVCQCFEDGCNSKAPHVMETSITAYVTCLLLLAFLHMS